MRMYRRTFMQLAGSAALAGAISGTAPSSAIHPSRYKAVAIDAFPIFDPRPIAKLTKSLFPERGSELLNEWRTRQFEYQWLRALSGQYVDFLQSTRDSLLFATEQLGISLSEEKENELMSAWSNLQIWPDAADAIGELRAMGLRLAFLTNMTGAMIGDGLKAAKLESQFEAIISTDRIKTYKPAPAAYQLGVEHFGVPKEEILFVAFAGWDVAGAVWFGYPTFWVNRLKSPSEQLGVKADGAGPDLQALIEFVKQGADERGAG